MDVFIWAGQKYGKNCPYSYPYLTMWLIYNIKIHLLRVLKIFVFLQRFWPV